MNSIDNAQWLLHYLTFVNSSKNFFMGLKVFFEFFWKICIGSFEKFLLDQSLGASFTQNFAVFVARNGKKC